MRAGSISYLIETFEYAVSLARGEPDIDKPAAPTVSEDNMLAAHAYATNIDEIFKDLYVEFAKISSKWSPFTREDARNILGRTVDAARRFESETRFLSGSVQRSTGQALSLKSGWAPVWVRGMRVAQETLEIIAGERTIEQSIYQEMNIAREEFFWTTLPVIGELVLVYEAVGGREFTSAKKLTTSERAMIAAGLLLPRVLGHVAKAGGVAVRVTRRAIILALDDLKVYGITRTGEKLQRSLMLAYGLRILPDAEFKEFADLMRLVSVAQTRNLLAFLTNRQISRLNFYLSRMRDSARAAAWLDIVAKETGNRVKGYIQLGKGVKAAIRETLGLKLLAEQSGEAVIHLPKTNPSVYPKIKSLEGEKYPDAIWKREPMDIYCPDGKTTENTLQTMITRKWEQAPTVVVALLDQGLTKDDIKSVVYGKIWPHPSATGISQVVVVDSSGLIILKRPTLFTPPMMKNIIRLGLDDTKKLAVIYSELENEPQ